MSPKKDGGYYGDRYSYENYVKGSPNNLYGIKFAPGYFDFGASGNIRDRHMGFVVSQPTDRLNTNIESNI